jgi:hypothetical protein
LNPLLVSLPLESDAETMHMLREIFQVLKSEVTHCISTMLPDIPDGARLSRLRHPELRFLNPKNR